MKKLVLFAAVLFLTACHTGGQLKLDSSVALNPAELFSELAITDGGAVSPTFITSETHVDNSKNIKLNIKAYEDFSKLKGECSGSAALDDADYESILKLVAAADLGNYRPADYSEGGCEPLLGWQGVTVNYIQSDKSNNTFTTACELDPKIQELLDAVDALAEKYITDCTADKVVGGNPPPEEPSKKDEFCGTASKAECAADGDCKIGGCAPICEGKDESNTTICDARECYDYNKYGVACGCVDNQCQWK